MFVDNGGREIQTQRRKQSACFNQDRYGTQLLRFLATPIFVFICLAEFQVRNASLIFNFRFLL